MTASTATSDAFPRNPLPKRFCNLDRVLHALEARGLDGIVATLPNNVFYLSGFNGIAHKSDEPRVCAVMLSRHAPEHPVMVVADYYLATFLTQPTWIEDIRPFRAVMMPLDLPRAESRHRPLHPAGRRGGRWIERARRQLHVRHGQRAARARCADLKLDRGQGRLRRPGLRPEARRRRPDGRRRLRPDDVRPRGQDRRRDRPAPPRDAPQRGGHPQDGRFLGEGRDLARSQHRLRPLGGRARRLRARPRRHGVGPSARHRCDHHAADRASRTARWRPARTSCSTATAPSISTAGTAARPGWSTASREGDAKRWAKATSAVAETLLAAMKPGRPHQGAAGAGARDLPQGRRARSRPRRRLLPRPRAVAHGARADDRRRHGRNGDWVLEEGMVAPDPSALSGRPVRPLVVRGGGRDPQRRRQAAVLVGLRSDHRDLDSRSRSAGATPTRVGATKRAVGRRAIEK